MSLMLSKHSYYSDHLENKIDVTCFIHLTSKWPRILVKRKSLNGGATKQLIPCRHPHLISKLNLILT